MFIEFASLHVTGGAKRSLYGHGSPFWPIPSLRLWDCFGVRIELRVERHGSSADCRGRDAADKSDSDRAQRSRGIDCRSRSRAFGHSTVRSRGNTIGTLFFSKCENGCRILQRRPPLRRLRRATHLQRHNSDYSNCRIVLRQRPLSDRREWAADSYRSSVRAANHRRRGYHNQGIVVPMKTFLGLAHV
jgi:hypothetical protein